MYKVTVLLFALGAAIAVSGSVVPRNDNPIISTTAGQVQGETLSCGIGCNYFSWKGIPYAAPPVGNLRFRAPVDPTPWTGVRPALEHGPACPSTSFLSPTVDEDCLSLNVYTKSLDSNLPVMVWIHGGSFQGQNGHSFTYGPDHLVDEDILMVTINYRLGALGFLSTGDTNAPGNYGMKDAIKALEWIRHNIRNFGGDPDNVTIFGESAGGAAVHYLILSPSARGYFHKAIAQSGSALSPWAYQYNPRDAAYQLARDLGLPDTMSTAELVNALRIIPAMALVDATPGSMDYPVVRGTTPIPFVPCQDPAGTTGNEIFLPRHPLDIMESGGFNHVPFIIGYTSAESLVMIRELTLDGTVFEQVNANNEVLVPFQWNVTQGSASSRQIAEAISNQYWSGAALNNNLREEWTTYLSDSMFNWGVDTTARMHSERQAQSVYYYRFSFVGTLNLIRNLLLVPREFEGAVHGDDIFYLFSVTSLPPPLFPTNESIMTRRRMVRLWSNFAKFGNPTQNRDLIVNVNWDPVFGTQEFLDIDTELIPGRWPYQQRMNFWNNLRDTHV